jgi:hypothetical protein
VTESCGVFVRFRAPLHAGAGGKTLHIALMENKDY